MSAEDFAVGRKITWMDDCYPALEDYLSPEGEYVIKDVVIYLSGIITRICPQSIVVEIESEGHTKQRRLDKFSLSSQLDDRELAKAIMDSVNQPPPRKEDTTEYVVYALSDPRDNSIHYVGISKNIQKRFKQHLTCSGMNLQKNIWMVELLQQNLQPNLII